MARASDSAVHQYFHRYGWRIRPRGLRVRALKPSEVVHLGHGSLRHRSEYALRSRPRRRGTLLGHGFIDDVDEDVLSFCGLHGHYTWTTAVNLVGGRPDDFELDWFQTGRCNPRLGFEDGTPDIDQAVGTAKAARAAVVNVSDYNGEGFDRPNLSLPGDETALIDAVAKAHARTGVVLNTGGAVLVPWLGHVAAVIEACYPGEEDGNAAAAVLFGSIDPAGDSR